MLGRTRPLKAARRLEKLFCRAVSPGMVVLRFKIVALPDHRLKRFRPPCWRRNGVVTPAVSWLASLTRSKPV